MANAFGPLPPAGRLGGSTFGNLNGGLPAGHSTFGNLNPGKRIGFNPPRIRGLGRHAPPLGQSAIGPGGIGAVNATGQPFGTVPQPPAPKPPPQAPTPPSPLDSTYWANVNANQFKTNNQINQLSLDQALANTQLQSGLAQLDYNQPRAALSLEERANARGGLYSSVYNQQLGDQNYQYAGQRGGLVSRFGGTEMTDAAKIAALQGDIPLYNAQQALLSAQRESQLAAKNPAVPALPAPPKAGGGKAGGGKGDSGGKGKGKGGKPPALNPSVLARGEANRTQALAKALSRRGPKGGGTGIIKGKG